jgi:hypothetical protein
MVLRIPIDGIGFMAIVALMGRADVRVRFASGICCSIYMDSIYMHECEYLRSTV